MMICTEKYETVIPTVREKYEENEKRVSLSYKPRINK